MVDGEILLYITQGSEKSYHLKAINLELQKLAAVLFYMFSLLLWQNEAVLWVMGLP